MQPVSKQRLGKHASAKAVTSATIETVFSVGSVQGACKRSECSDRVSSRGVVTSYESVVSWRSGFRRIFSSEVRG
jgi:hypothetical protein